MNDTPKSAKSQAILDEMRPLGEWLMEAAPMTRVLGRMQFAKRYGDDALRAFDKEWEEKNSRYNKLSAKYRKQRLADMKEIAL